MHVFNTAIVPTMSVQATCYQTVILGTVLVFVTLTGSLASSLPPENQNTNLHLTPMEHKSSYAPEPFEDTHNSILSGGREVEPLPPDTALLAAVNASSSPSSVKKELGAATLSGDKEGFLHKDEPSQALDQEDQTTPVTTVNIEMKPFNDYADVERESHSVSSSVVPRKGVGEMPSSVVARKGAEFNSSDSYPETELVMTTSNSEDLITVTSTPAPSTSTPYSTSTASGFIAAAPVNDIPIPPVKRVTTARSATIAPPPPSPSLAYAPSSLSYAPPPPPASPPTKHASKHLKPAVAVDAVSNKALDNTPVIMGVTFGVLLIVVLAIVAYKRLQDVWSRRHYDRMDFLIDGMYDL